MPPQVFYCNFVRLHMSLLEALDVHTGNIQGTEHLLSAGKDGHQP